MALRLGLAFLTSILCLGSVARSQATRPTAPDPRVEMRANQAFNRGQYAVALPLLQQVASDVKGEPSRLGAVQEKIRVCQKALDALKNAATPAELQVIPGQPNTDIPMDPETRKKHPAPKPGDVLDLSIKELGNFEYDNENGGNIPADVKRLNGAEIRLHGFMIPMDQAENITQFALVPSLFSCCFGQPPQIQHTIVVNCPKGKAVSYCPDEIVVQGKLSVQERRDDGYVVSIFEVGTDSVKVAGK